MSRRCHYKHPRFEDGQCPRPARRGWTTCPSHASAGMNYAHWLRAQKQKLTVENYCHEAPTWSANPADNTD